MRHVLILPIGYASMNARDGQGCLADDATRDRDATWTACCAVRELAYNGNT
jgi:hypothetical protein